MSRAARALAVLVALAAIACTLGAAMFYAGAPLGPAEPGPCWDERYGRELPPMLGNDC